MSIIVANWSDKQLDELLDLLKSADFSPLAAFIFENFLASGNRIMSDTSGTGGSNLRLTVNATDGKAVDLSPGVLQVGGLVSHISSAQTINILATTIGAWGTGQAADAAQPRYSLICIKNAWRRTTPDNRWFVNDSVEPNVFSQAMTNTEREMSYYDIYVVHGTPGAAIESITVPTGYWCIGEVYVPADATFANPVLLTNIRDTGLASWDSVPHWTTTSRVLRLEFWSTLFGVDHRSNDGGHKAGSWHIGDPAVAANAVTASAAELNKLTGAGVNVTAPHLDELTGGASTVLHTHGSTGFGVWDTKLDNTIYQAATDGFVLATSVQGANENVIGYTDSANPPTVVRIRSKSGFVAWAQTPISSITMPVKKNDFWKVTGTSGGFIYWIPLGV